jgi:hypothetical protein
MTEQETPEIPETPESDGQPRNEKGQFLPKPKVEPLYSKRNPENTDKTGTISQTITEYRDLLLEQIHVELPEDFEKENIRTQIKILKYMTKSGISKPDTSDAPTEHPLDKTKKAEVGGVVPASTTIEVPSLLEKNRADIFIRQARAKTGFSQYRKKWEQQ